jgi:DNA replication protein DnaC
MNSEVLNSLNARARKLGLWGLLAEWSSVCNEPWLTTVIEYEETARDSRSLERRLQEAKLGAFKPLADFDWHWPKEIDRELIDELVSLQFIADLANVIIIGQNGVGKTMLAKNLAHHAILRGHSARFITASALLNDLASQETASAQARRLRYYSRPQLLVIDEFGYLASSSEHADLLFQLINCRYQLKSTIITSNKPFAEWNSVFPNASCVTALIDRLVHKTEIISIAADSYRLKESRERTQQRNKTPRNKTSKSR